MQFRFTLAGNPPLCESFVEKVNSFSVFAAKNSNLKHYENETVQYPPLAGAG
jgi:hypothetical protein